MDSLDHVFILMRDIMEGHTSFGQGKLSLDCERQQLGKEPGFRLILHGPYPPYAITKTELLQYQQQGFLTQSAKPLDPFELIERCILEVLNESGYGGVSVSLEGGKKEGHAVTIVQNVSYRRYIR